MSYDSGTGKSSEKSTSDSGGSDYEYAIEDNDEVSPLTTISSMPRSHVYSNWQV